MDADPLLVDLLRCILRLEGALSKPARRDGSFDSRSAEHRKRLAQGDNVPPLGDQRAWRGAPNALFCPRNTYMLVRGRAERSRWTWTTKSESCVRLRWRRVSNLAESQALMLHNCAPRECPALLRFCIEHCLTRQTTGSVLEGTVPQLAQMSWSANRTDVSEARSPLRRGSCP